VGDIRTTYLGKVIAAPEAWKQYLKWFAETDAGERRPHLLEILNYDEAGAEELDEELGVKAVTADFYVDHEGPILMIGAWAAKCIENKLPIRGRWVELFEADGCLYWEEYKIEEDAVFLRNISFEGEFRNWTRLRPDDGRLEKVVLALGEEHEEGRSEP